jgi:glycosyltransferase involved in cell wall biosynthesis
VNESLAEVLQARYAPRRTIVVHNCPRLWDPPPELTDHLRGTTGIEPTSPVILYHGSIGPHRGIEQILLALLEPGLDAAHLVLLGPSWHTDHYEALATDKRWRGRVHVLPPVTPGELAEWVHSADVGCALIQPTTLNHRLSTPNKLFECLAAGVPVVTSDFPSMRRIVLATPSEPLGATCDPADIGMIAAAIRSIIELGPSERTRLRTRCLNAAHQRWNWESEVAGLTGLYDDLLGAVLVGPPA